MPSGQAVWHTGRVGLICGYAGRASASSRRSRSVVVVAASLLRASSTSSSATCHSHYHVSYSAGPSRGKMYDAGLLEPSLLSIAAWPQPLRHVVLPTWPC